MLSGQKEDAEALRLDIQAGYATPADAVAWADRVIVEDPHPDDAVLDVSLAWRASAPDMLALLANVPGVADPVRVLRRHLGTMLRILDAEPGRVVTLANRLDILASRGQMPADIFGTDPYLIAEVFELSRIPAHASEAEAREDLRLYLLAHAL
jgi:hypothetical protein